jgi:hypothetical protein
LQLATRKGFGKTINNYKKETTEEKKRTKLFVQVRQAYQEIGGEGLNVPGMVKELVVVLPLLQEDGGLPVVHLPGYSTHILWQSLTPPHQLLAQSINQS